MNENVAESSMATRQGVHVDRPQDGDPEAAMLVSGGVLTPELLHLIRSGRGLKARVVGTSNARECASVDCSFLLWVASSASALYVMTLSLT